MRDAKENPIRDMLKFINALLVLIFLLAGCNRTDPIIIVVTSTATSQANVQAIPMVVTATLDPSDRLLSTAGPQLDAVATPETKTYTVQHGDTLSGIAAKFGVRLQTLLKINQIEDPNILEVGQIILLPGEPTTSSPEFKLISDSHFIRGPNSKAFDISAFVSQQPGYILTASDTVDEVLLSAADVVQRVSLEYSVDARLLLAVLQYRSHWLTQTDLTDDLKQFPIQGRPSPDGFDRSGLYKQLAWAANQLNAGYYGWKYKGLDALEFDDGTHLGFGANLNPGTIGVQYFFSVQSDYLTWETAINNDGIYKTYASFFGDPLMGDADVTIPLGLQQPELTFPFPSGQTWFFTGGPHGGWGTGSAWSAIDFAPPDDRPEGSAPCYVSENWGTAAAPGIIARSGDGAVILDLDGDGDESTGWTILYLHMASDGRVQTGTRVKIGDQIGRPSCEGGVSNATHMHVARRYNGEWIPVSCDVCKSEYPVPSFVLNGWTAVGLPNQEYQGYMVKGGDRRDAEQGRLTPINRISW